MRMLLKSSGTILELFELNTQMDSLSLPVVRVLVEDRDDLTMLRWYNASRGHNLQVRDLVVADALHINQWLIGEGNDTNIVTYNTTVCTTINEGTLAFRVVLANMIGDLMVACLVSFHGVKNEVIGHWKKKKRRPMHWKARRVL